MRSTAPGTERATCTDDTGYRTDCTRCAGIFRRNVPRTVPRGRRVTTPHILGGEIERKGTRSAASEITGSKSDIQKLRDQWSSLEDNEDYLKVVSLIAAPA